MSVGLSKIVNPLFSDDTLATVEACKSLGVFVEKVKNGFLIEGKEKLKAPEKPINCKLSAATLRFMVAVACLAEGKTILTGENGLLKRPIEPLIQALNQLGVNCKSSNGFPPVTVYGGNLKGGKTSIVGNVSSQFISGLLFISPLAKNNVEICLTTPLESKPYVQLTLEILKKHGINIEGLEIIPGGKTFRWGGRYHTDLNVRDTLFTELGVFESFSPKIPEDVRDDKYVVLGNIHPALQLQVLEQLKSPKLIICDTMNLWIDTALDGLKEVIKKGGKFKEDKFKMLPVGLPPKQKK